MSKDSSHCQPSNKRLNLQDNINGGNIRGNKHGNVQGPVYNGINGISSCCTPLSGGLDGGDVTSRSSRQYHDKYLHFNISSRLGEMKLNNEPDTFAGRRDVRCPSSVEERQIVSARGTVRGYKNRVRAGIATFLEPINDKIDEEARNYYQHERGKIVIYTTSMCVVRDTWEKCKLVRNILQTHMMRYDEKDLYMSRDNQRELAERMGGGTIRVPQVFVDGVYIGGAFELEKLNECGELRNLFQHFQKITVRFACSSCGGYRYVPCGYCHGSKKSLFRNNFTEEFCALRCMQCDESGLQRCEKCKDQQD